LYRGERESIAIPVRSLITRSPHHRFICEPTPRIVDFAQELVGDFRGRDAFVIAPHLPKVFLASW